MPPLFYDYISRRHAADTLRRRAASPLLSMASYADYFSLPLLIIIMPLRHCYFIAAAAI